MSASETPLLDQVAEDGPLAEGEAAAAMLRLTTALIESVATNGGTTSLVPLLNAFPDNVLMQEDGTIKLSNGTRRLHNDPTSRCERSAALDTERTLTTQPRPPRVSCPHTDDGASRQSARSPFVAPELVASSSEASDPGAATSWSLGVLCYTLLAGYPPFEASSDVCPFFKDFTSMHRLACPPQFSRPAIALLCSLLCVAPEGRMKLQELPRACSAWAVQAAEEQRRTAAACSRAVTAARSQVTASLSALSLSHASASSAGSALSKRRCCGLANVSETEATVPEAAMPQAAAADETGSPLSDSSGRVANGGVGAPPDAVLSPVLVDPPSPDSFVQRAVVGPHGTPLAEVRSGMSPHPNSPHDSSSQRVLGQPARLVAVIYSPSTNLPRKTTLPASAVASLPTLYMRASADVGGSLSARPPLQSGLRVGRRLGWDVRFEGEPAALLAEMARTMSERLGIQTTVEPQLLRLTTAEVQVSRDMGLGTMRAQMQLSVRSAEPPRAYRLDVKRQSGDTFQFHAFYRSIRESLAWLNGWTGSDYRTDCGEGAAGATHEGGAGGLVQSTDDARSGGAAGWGRRM